ncbi:MAG: hypothetical protein Tsb0013_03720 [Phycisphaerales bacterium]
MLAATYLRSDPHHTLQPTALVHEAYIKLAQTGSNWESRNHFVATAAIAMRQILVDHARRRTALKRGGSGRRVDLSIELLPEAGDAPTSRDIRVLELDDLLSTLARSDQRAARVAELRLFGGMDLQQIASVLSVSRTTVVNDWSFARAWLASEAGGAGVEGAAGDG